MYYFYFLKGVLPKSCNPDHIPENINIFCFQIPEEDVYSLNSLDKGKHYCWNSATILWIALYRHELCTDKFLSCQNESEEAMIDERWS